MRFPYLATVAWGRSAWAPPEENEWDATTQTTRPTTTRTAPRLAGQYEEDVQQYDNNLRPINPASQSSARDRRIAANNILSIIGVVEQTHDTELEKTAEKQDKEAPYLIPVFFLTRTVLMITSQWILNVTNRLLAYSSTTDMSLMMTINRDFTILGPWAFFFSGIPATLAEFFVRPSWLAPLSCYWLFRALLASISDLNVRSFLVNKSPLVFQFLWGVFELFDFPFRLNVLLQQLGLVAPFGILPTFHVFRAIYGSPLELINTPLPAMFISGPLAHFVNRSIVKPNVVPFIDWMFQVFEDDPPRTMTPATSPPGLRSNARGRPSNTPDSQSLQDSEPSRRPEARSRPVTSSVSLLLLDDEESVTPEAPIEPDSSNNPGNTQISSSNTAPPASAASPGEQPATEGELYHQIRISGHENSDGALIEELNISFYDRFTEARAASDPISSSMQQSQRNRTHRHALPLSDTPQRIAEALITAHVTSILLQPWDAWILPRVANWWITTQEAYPQAMGEIAVAPFFSTNTIQSVLSKTSKLILCIAIREIIMTSVWVWQTKTVVWLGNWRLGWTTKRSSLQ